MVQPWWYLGTTIVRQWFHGRFFMELLYWIGFLSHWYSYAVLSLEEVARSSYSNMVEWFWWD